MSSTRLRRSSNIHVEQALYVRYTFAFHVDVLASKRIQVCAKLAHSEHNLVSVALSFARRSEDPTSVRCYDGTECRDFPHRARILEALMWVSSVTILDYTPKTSTVKRTLCPNGKSMRTILLVLLVVSWLLFSGSVLLMSPKWWLWAWIAWVWWSSDYGSKKSVESTLKRVAVITSIIFVVTAIMLPYTTE